MAYCESFHFFKLLLAFAQCFCFFCILCFIIFIILCLVVRLRIYLFIFLRHLKILCICYSFPFFYFKCLHIYLFLYLRLGPITDRISEQSHLQLQIHIFNPFFTDELIKTGASPALILFVFIHQFVELTPFLKIIILENFL